ncbi:Long-chain-fatty-acid--CoA ligase [Crocosphaera watsonii WH 0402]|uniref:Long-chain-fatty-acid--CoA ligase n=2 Tax=Crocosphaera watsonii TaxID=263511 RepID=T2JZP6_CROWT|nr:Long-chain-fatty-acid--CoA ligase [Crocosphaera watsonii WH 0005]CCQ70760.1 Long-chain-fatty-acid--CoA ligase [Crocosphaera watsonii WH 0402]
MIPPTPLTKGGYKTVEWANYHSWMIPPTPLTKGGLKE